VLSEITGVAVKRDGSTTIAVNTQRTIPGGTTRLIEDRILDSSICETQSNIATTTVEKGEPDACEDAAAYSHTQCSADSATTDYPSAYKIFI